MSVSFHEVSEKKGCNRLKFAEKIIPKYFYASDV